MTENQRRTLKTRKPQAQCPVALSDINDIALAEDALNTPDKNGKLPTNPRLFLLGCKAWIDQQGG